MLYHRLLSSLLANAYPGSDSPDPLDFAALWHHAGVDPTLKLPDKFLQQTGLAPDPGDSAPYPIPALYGLSCLDDIAAAWRHTAAALNAPRVDRTLTLVYRLQPQTRPKKARPRRKRRSRKSAPLSDAEAALVAVALQASVSDVRPGGGGDDGLARAVFASLQEAARAGDVVEDVEPEVLAHPFGLPLEGEGFVRGGGGGSGLSADAQMAWALQASLLSRVEDARVLQEAEEAGESAAGPEPAGEAAKDTNPPIKAETGAEPEPKRLETGESERMAEDAPESAASSPESAQEGSLSEEDVMLEEAQQIIGTKTFALDDAFLDEYLERVLAWWHGEREPVGVEVELTRRCVYVQSFLLVVAKAFQADGCRFSGLASIVTGANGGRRRQRKRWRGTELAACLLRLWPLQERRRLGYSTRF